MAVTTTSALQAALVTLLGNDIKSECPVRVLEEDHTISLLSRWYISGNPSRAATPTVINAPRAMWISTTKSNTVANQAIEVLAAMASSDPSGTVTRDGNVDPDVGP